MSQASDFPTRIDVDGASLGTGLGTSIGTGLGGRAVSALSHWTAGLIVGLLDVIIITLSCVTANVIYQAVLGGTADLQPVAGIGLFSAAFFVLLMRTRNLYSLEALASSTQQLRGGAMCWAIVLLGLLSLLFLLKLSAEFSRGAMLLFGAGTSIIFVAVRAIVARQIAAAWERGTLAGRRALLIGMRDELATSAGRNVLARYGVTDIQSFMLSERSAGGDGLDARTIDDAVGFAIANRVELILLLLPWSDQERIRLVCERLRALPLQVLLLPDRVVSSVIAGPREQSTSQLTVEVQRAPLTPVEMLAKRIFDVAAASLALVSLSVLMAIAAVLIKLGSPGPVIFRQRRRGFNGQPFTIFKFRTMSVMEDGDQVRQAARQDARTTGIGRMLRRSSIDELPQLFNVLRGEMSIVGPRPHAVAHDNEYSRMIENYALRHHMKPGITGWAQINGLRGRTDQQLMQRRVDLDLWYINNWSLLLDVRITARTFIEVVRGQNAW